MAKFIIITPAHNEQDLIKKTIESMIKQKVRPNKWIIANDGSTDRTGDIVQEYAEKYEFIDLANVERTGERNFGHKVHAFNYGLSKIRHIDYDYIGNLDADISFDANYFEAILNEFTKDNELGIAGGMVHSKIGENYTSQKVSLDSVAGAVQLFRRECYEQIGGYKALPLGGIDAAAEIMARMQGWKVQTFPNLAVYEHRRTGTANNSPLFARVKEGKRLYVMGYSLMFFCMRCLFRSLQRPILIGSLAAICGYLVALFKREPIVLPIEVVRNLRREQRMKLLDTFKQMITRPMKFVIK